MKPLVLSSRNGVTISVHDTIRQGRRGLVRHHGRERAPWPWSLVSEAVIAGLRTINGASDGTIDEGAGGGEKVRIAELARAGQRRVLRLAHGAMGHVAAAPVPSLLPPAVVADVAGVGVIEDAICDGGLSLGAAGVRAASPPGSTVIEGRSNLGRVATCLYVRDRRRDG